MKSLNNRLIIFLIIAYAGFASCKKSFYDLKPYDALDPNAAATTDAELNVLLNGMYAGLRNVDLYGRTLPVKGDLSADNVYLRTGNSGRYSIFRDFNQTVANTEANNVWVAAYDVIKRANHVINSNLASTPTIDEMKGEAYAVRALMHFELVRNFAHPYTVAPNDPGVPIITTIDKNSLPGRNSVKEVYSQIINDLNKAYSLISLNQGDFMDITATSTSRLITSEYISKYAAKGLLAKVYLTMGDWANARDAALDVINNSGFSVIPVNNYLAYWADPGSRSDRIETLFEVSSDGTTNLGTNSLSAFYQLPPVGYGDLWVTNDLYSQYSATDVRQQLIIPDNTAQDGVTVFIVNKYSNTSNPSDKDDTKILRFSDVILILAESYAHMGDDTSALNWLNLLLKERDPDFAGYTSSGNQLLSDILQERRKELAFEGDRYWDFMRLNLPINNHLKNQNPEVIYPISVDNPHRIFPIPQTEIDVNPNIRNQQNPGY